MAPSIPSNKDGNQRALDSNIYIIAKKINCSPPVQYRENANVNLASSANV